MLALVHLRGSDATVVRDITDISHPFTVATPAVAQWQLPALDTVRFVSPTEISESFGGLVRMSFDGATKTTVAADCQGGLVAFAWSRDGTKVAYVWEKDRPFGSTPPWLFELHVVQDGVDSTIGTAPAWCHCGEGVVDKEDLRLAFSAGGDLVSWVTYAGIASDFQVRRLDGTLVGAEIRPPLTDLDTQYTTMSVWSSNALYYRDARGIEVWRNGSVSPFLPGVAWIRPRASPAGDQIVYEARDSTGLGHVFVVDTASGTVRQLTSTARVEPFFLTPRYVWYEGERLCVSGDQCYFGAKTIATGKTYIYDVATETESESIVTNVADTWPHAA